MKTEPGISYLHACIEGRSGRSLRTVGRQITALDSDPAPGDRVVDLQGARLLPGLINAHDHLQLNSLPRPAPGPSYQHVREWINQIGRRPLEPEMAAGAAVAREERLLIGGVKNLLSGATTVAHHDPFYAALGEHDFPVTVASEYGWSHSLYLDGAEQVRDSHQRTPRSWPWIIHLAEGIDAEAAAEFDRLEQLGCLGPNTVIAHGISLDARQRQRLAQAGGGLIWCPASNLQLFGRSAAIDDACLEGRIALGTDSRLSGSRDLLDELAVAAQATALPQARLERMVLLDSARLLRLADRAVLRPGARADLLVLPAAARLGEVRRAAVRLVVVGGIPRYGEADLARAAAPALDWAPLRVDGTAKVIDPGLAARLARAGAREPGLELTSISWRAA